MTIERSLETTDPKGREMGRYVKHLRELRKIMIESGLNPPTEKIKVIPGTEGEGRPLGAYLPAYPKNECNTNEESMSKVLFNLQSLTGFVPPKK